jgi:hypothetical protein
LIELGVGRAVTARASRRGRDGPRVDHRKQHEQQQY